MLEYAALFILFFVSIMVFYGIIAIHDIPYEIAKHRNHPYSEVARQYFPTVPIIPQVRGRVVEISVEPNARRSLVLRATIWTRPPCSPRRMGCPWPYH